MPFNREQNLRLRRRIDRVEHRVHPGKRYQHPDPSMEIRPIHEAKKMHDRLTRVERKVLGKVYDFSPREIEGRLKQLEKRFILA